MSVLFAVYPVKIFPAVFIESKNLDVQNRPPVIILYVVTIPFELKPVMIKEH
jgi:hypothetical protein